MSVKRDRDKTDRDLYLLIHEEAATIINNLHSVLFAAFIAGFASAILSIILKFNDFDEIFKYPAVIVVPAALWLISLIFLILITSIFIVSVYFGFRILQIEIAIRKEPAPSGESENFISINKSSRAHRCFTRVYYPGLYYSGYTHSYFLMIALITFIVTVILISIQYNLIASAYEPPLSSGYSAFYRYVADHNIFLMFCAALIFLLVCFIIIPRLIPNTKRLVAGINNAELLVVSETLHHLHGTEVFLVSFAKHAIKAGKKLLLIGPLENKNDVLFRKCRQECIPLVQLPSYRTWFLGQPEFSIANPLFLRRLISAEVKHVFINGFPGPLSVYSLILGKFKKKKLIFFYHVYLPKFVECIPLLGKRAFVKRFFNWLTCKFSNNCDLVIVPSVSVYKEMILWGVEEGKLKIIPTGVDKYFLYPPQIDEIRREKAKYSYPILLSVGRLSQEKNLELLLKAFPSVLKKFPSANTIIVGNGPLLNHLKSLAKELEIVKSVKFLGFLDWSKLKPLYWASDVFCMTSLGETQGLCIQEAKACQRPCVVLNKVGAGEQITDSVDGLLVEESENEQETIARYATALDRILCQKDFSQSIAIKARKNALKRTNEKSFKQLIEAIEDV